MLCEIPELTPKSPCHNDINISGLSKAGNKSERKSWLTDNPKAKQDIKKRNATTLTKVAKGLSDHLNSVHPKELVGHIRTVLHAHATPMQAEGHEHIKHITYGEKRKS